DREHGETQQNPHRTAGVRSGWGGSGLGRLHQRGIVKVGNQKGQAECAARGPQAFADQGRTGKISGRKQLPGGGQPPAAQSGFLTPPNPMKLTLDGADDLAAHHKLVAAALFLKPDWAAFPDPALLMLAGASYIRVVEMLIASIDCPYQRPLRIAICA